MFSGTGNRGAHERHPLFSSPQAAPPARFPRKHAGHADDISPSPLRTTAPARPPLKKTRPFSEKTCTARPIMLFSFLDPGRRLPLKKQRGAPENRRAPLNFIWISVFTLQGGYPRPAKLLSRSPFKAIISLPTRQAENFRQKPLTVDKNFLLYPKTGVRPPKKRPLRLLHRGRKGGCLSNCQVPISVSGYPRHNRIDLSRAVRFSAARFTGNAYRAIHRGFLPGQFAEKACLYNLLEKPAKAACGKSCPKATLALSAPFLLHSIRKTNAIPVKTV